MRRSMQWARKAAHQLTREELILRAKNLRLPGINKYFGEQGNPDTEKLGMITTRAESLRRRIVETERERRERRLWMVALASAIASAFSAAAAWLAIWVSK